MAECAICWNTGFYHGHGGPCSQGCKPTDHQHGIHKAWNRGRGESKTGVSSTQDSYTFVIQDVRVNYYTELKELLRKATEGHEVRIVWPSTCYAVRADPRYRTIELKGNWQDCVNYRYQVSKELHIESTSTPLSGGVILRPLTPVTVKPSWVVSGTIVEGKAGTCWSGEIAKITRLNNSGSTQTPTVSLEFLDKYGHKRDEGDLILGILLKDFEPNPYWRPKIKQPTPQLGYIAPLKVDQQVTFSASEVKFDIKACMKAAESLKNFTRAVKEAVNKLSAAIRETTDREATKITRPEWKAEKQWPVTFSAAEIEKMKEDLDPRAFAQEYMGTFSKFWERDASLEREAHYRMQYSRPLPVRSKYSYLVSRTPIV